LVPISMTVNDRNEPIYQLSLFPELTL